MSTSWRSKPSSSRSAATTPRARSQRWHPAAWYSTTSVILATLCRPLRQGPERKPEAYAEADARGRSWRSHLRPHRTTVRTTDKEGAGFAGARLTQRTGGESEIRRRLTTGRYLG